MTKLQNVGTDASGIPQFEYTGHYITGLSGCNCHPFSSWIECEFFHKQKFEIGDKVQQRCLNKSGIVDRILPERGYYIIKYGPLPNQHELEHAAQLILIK